MRSARRILLSTVVVFVVGGPLLGAAPAQATETHPFQSTFNASDAPLGSKTPLETPNALAVDNSGTASDGRVYVADNNHAVIDIFSATGKYLTQITGSETDQGSFSTPYGLAIDQSDGDLYVSDLGFNVVDKFDSTGKLIKAFGTAGQISVPSPTGVAVDPQTGDLYVGDYGDGVIDVFSSNGEYQRQFPSNGGDLSLAADSLGDIFTTNGSEADVFVAATGELNTSYGAGSGVIDSGGSRSVGVDPANDDVYVDDNDHIVQYDKTGNQISSFGQGDLFTSVGVGVDDTSGDVYAANQGTSDVAIFGPLAIVPTPETGEATKVTRTTAILQGAVNPESITVEECAFEYVTEVEFDEQGGFAAPGVKSVTCESPDAAEIPVDSNTHLVHAAITGLVRKTPYRFRLVGKNENGAEYGSAEPFETSSAIIGLATKPATNVLPTSATINGVFEGNGEDTHYYFKWGTTESYGNTTAIPPGVDAGSSPVETPVSFNLTRLLPATEYHYRIVAENSVGTSEGLDRTFTTPAAPPTITTESVSDVHSESAMLNAKINPGGDDTTYHFEYGTDTLYGASEPVPDGDIGSGRTFQGVQLHLGGLAPGTTYHWRVVATNAIETVSGPDHTFTTFPFLSKLNESCSNSLARQQTGAALLLDCRAYELVSAPNTGGYNVSSDLAEGKDASFGGYPEAENPSEPNASARVLYSVDSGAIPGTNHPTNKGSDPYVATRSEDGWSTEYVGVPATNPFAAEPFSSVPSGVDAGLETFAFGAPGGCSPCFEGGYTGVPVRLPSGELVQGMAGSLDPGPTAKPAGYIGKELSADGTHFVFGSRSRFEPDANEGEIAIYDRDLLTGETHVVSKTPGGETMKEEGQEISELDISKEGSHILIGKLTGKSEGQKLYHLYMNVGDSSQTIDLTPGATEGVRFDGMTSDGTEVFFSSEEHLTDEDPNHTGPDIFLWQEGHPLKLISTGTEGDASSCNPVANSLHKHWNTTGAQNCGAVAIGGGGGVASGDGTFYFLSPSLLDGTEEPPDGVKGAPNLYVVRPDQAPHFVATLESSLTGPLQFQHRFLQSLGSFVSPEFIAMDPTTGDIYVADTSTNTVYKITSTGEPDTSWHEHGKLVISGSPRFSPIVGITTNPSNGDLYIDQVGEVRGLKVLAPDGTLIENLPQAGGRNSKIAVSASGKLYAVEATGVAVDPTNGDLYVDEEGKTVTRYSFNGAEEVIEAKVITSELSGASGIAVDAAHNVFVDEGNRVLEFNSSGEEATVPFGEGLLHGSAAVAVSSTGGVYVSNSSHSNLAEFGPLEPDPNPMTDNPLVADAVSEPDTRHTADFQLTPSGQFAAFTSTLPLTGTESGGFPEVFRYDAVSDTLDCASCNPSGAEAISGSSLAIDGSSLTEAGQVFFNSSEPLALSDTDNLSDVYEWEPAGTGTCSAQSPTYAKVSGDCLGLISTGTSTFSSKLLGVSLNGIDAYFFTRDSLVPQDENGELVKIYDARMGGGFFVTPEPPLCKSSDECHGGGSSPPPPPDFHRNPLPGGNQTATVNKSCKRGFLHRHGKCVRKPKQHRRRKRSMQHRRGSQ